MVLLDAVVSGPLVVFPDAPALPPVSVLVCLSQVAIFMVPPGDNSPPLSSGMSSGNPIPNPQPCKMGRAKGNTYVEQ